jgi:hypothetical protein
MKRLFEFLKVLALILGLPIVIWIWLAGWTLYTVDMPGIDMVINKLKEVNRPFAVIRET